MITLGLSTWSLHRTLESNQLNLLELPAALRAHGLTDLQICHFHLASREQSYLAELKASIADAGVMLDAMLLDFGDLTADTSADADETELRDWLETAAVLGARYARIAAGKQAPSEPALAQAARRLLSLAATGKAYGVQVITENWFQLLSSSKQVLRFQELTRNQIPLCIDFGNWQGNGKYAELNAIAPMAVTAHAKCAFSAPNAPDAADFRKCLTILRDTGFAGTIALIYDGPSADEWSQIDLERALVREIFPAA